MVRTLPLMAIEAQVPIVPVAIRNTDWMMGKRTGVAYPGTIELVLGNPIATEGMAEEDIPNLIAQTRRFVAGELAKERQP
jgi:1-acyl-sn-glycerol-3-phosphate acyltransferase